MGNSPKILEELHLTREELRAAEQEWYLDTETGELKPEEDPVEVPKARPQPRPRPVRVARQTFD